MTTRAMMMTTPRTRSRLRRGRSLLLLFFFLPLMLFFSTMIASVFIALVIIIIAVINIFFTFQTGGSGRMRSRKGTMRENEIISINRARRGREWTNNTGRRVRMRMTMVMFMICERRDQRRGIASRSGSRVRLRKNQKEGRR